MGILDAGLYRPGTTVLHRARPGAKLIGLAVFTVLVTLIDGVAAAVAALAVSIGAAFIAGLRGRDLWGVVRTVRFLVVILFAFQWWQQGWRPAAELVLELVAFVIAASVLTATTAVDDMISTITWALGPLRPFGVNSAAVGFTFSLAIRSISVVESIAIETGDAAKARGLERNMRAFATPFVIRVVAHARETGAALHARGIGDDGWD